MTVGTTVCFPRDMNFGAEGVQSSEDVKYAEGLCQVGKFLAKDLE